MKYTYNSFVYNALKAFIYLFTAFILIICLLLLISMHLNSILFLQVFLGCGFVCLCIIPFIFETKIKILFTKKIILEFDDMELHVNFYHIKHETLIEKLIINWADIESYKINFTPSKITYLDIYLKNGSSKTFGFKDDKTESEAIKTESVFSLFYLFVQQHNSIRDPKCQITLRPGFLTTKTGSFFLYFTIILAIFIIILNMIYVKKFPWSVMGLFFLLPLIAKRKQDKKIYTKINNIGNTIWSGV